jgi:hypothetical protein
MARNSAAISSASDSVDCPESHSVKHKFALENFCDDWMGVILNEVGEQALSHCKVLRLQEWRQQVVAPFGCELLYHVAALGYICGVHFLRHCSCDFLNRSSTKRSRKSHEETRNKAAWPTS